MLLRESPALLSPAPPDSFAGEVIPATTYRAGCEVPHGRPALPPRPLRWLFLDLNSYFAAVEQQLQPGLRGRPVIVAPVGADTTVAIAASVEAKRFGITTGTPVWEAKQKCRELIVTPARHDRYVEFHDAVVAEVWRHIPVTKVCSIDEMACRLLDNENTRQAAIALAARIKAGISANVGERLTASVGIAPNRLLAKLASTSRSLTVWSCSRTATCRMRSTGSTSARSAASARRCRRGSRATASTTSASSASGARATRGRHGAA